MKIHDRLLRRRLIVVTGKGGVGKSAMAAALGRSLADRGRRTLVLEVDPRENLHQLLDVPPSGGQMVSAGDRLYLQNLKPKDVVDWVVEDRLKVGMLARRVKKSAVYERFAEGAPGLKEMAIIGHCLRAVRGDIDAAPTVDTVVLDAPATGHGIYLLTAARLFAEAINEGPVADLAREVAEFVADGEDAGVVVVTLAEELPVEESLELRAALDERYGRAPDLLIANGVYPPLPSAAASEKDVENDDGLRTLWRRRRAVNARELARLESAWPGPKITVPLLPIDPGRPLVDALRTHLDLGLETGPETGLEEGS